MRFSQHGRGYNNQDGPRVCASVRIHPRLHPGLQLFWGPFRTEEIRVVGLYLCMCICVCVRGRPFPTHQRVSNGCNGCHSFHVGDMFFVAMF